MKEERMGYAMVIFINDKESFMKYRKDFYVHDGEFRVFDYDPFKKCLNVLVENGYDQESAQISMHFDGVVFLFVTNRIEWFGSEGDRRINAFTMKENDMFDAICKDQCTEGPIDVVDYQDMFNFCFQTFLGSEIYIVCRQLKIEVFGLREGV